MTKTTMSVYAYGQ